MISSISSLIFGIVPLAILGIIVYFFVKKGGGLAEGRKHAYFYLISFISLAILYWAISDLFRVVFGEWTDVSSASSVYAREKLLRQIAGRLSAIVVAFPIWAFHWMKANPPKDKGLDYGSRKVYSLVVVFCLIIIMLITWSTLLYYVFTWALGVSDNSLKEVLPGFFAYAVNATGVWVWHFRMWRKISRNVYQERLEQ